MAFGWIGPTEADLIYVAQTLLYHRAVSCPKRARHACRVYFKEFATCPRVVSGSTLPCPCNIGFNDHLIQVG